MKCNPSVLNSQFKLQEKGYTDKTPINQKKLQLILGISEKM